MNNAGTAIPKMFEEATLEELDRVIDINIRGTFVATQAALNRTADVSHCPLLTIGHSSGCARRDGSMSDLSP
jgi:3-oxoacyl-[acyl-carrier protein] reductase